MHLRNVRLNNFRCFQELDVPLHPRLTVLVAENSGGKTSVLDAIAVGLSPILGNLSSANQRLSGPGIKDTDFRIELRESPIGNSRSVASDFTQVVIETTNGLKWDVWKPSAPGKLPDEKIGQAELTAHTAKLLDSLNTPNPALLPVFAYYGARRGWIVIPERLRGSKVDHSQPTSALVGALDSLSDFKEMLNWFDAEEAAELRSRQGSLFEEYTEPVRNFFALKDVRSTIVSILDGAYDHPRFNEKHRFVVHSKADKVDLQVSQLSQGYQSMLALGMDFARRLGIANSHLHLKESAFDWSPIERYVEEHWKFGVPSATRGATWAPAVMLVDEIDLHLHPSWQQRVIGDLLRTFPCTQFIVTTHSPQVISTVPTECIRIIKDGSLYAATPGTDGAEAQRVLRDVFGVSPRPDTLMSRNLDEYLRLIDDRQWDSPRALELRRLLDDWSRGHEPRLEEADLQIENMKWEMGA